MGWDLRKFKGFAACFIISIRDCVLGQTAGRCVRVIVWLAALMIHT